MSIIKLSLASWHAAQGVAERAARAIPWPHIVKKAADFKRIADETEKKRDQLS